MLGGSSVLVLLRRFAAMISASSAAAPATTPPRTVSAFLRASGSASAARRVGPQLAARLDRPTGLRPRVEPGDQLVDRRGQLGARHGELGLERDHLRAC